MGPVHLSKERALGRQAGIGTGQCPESLSCKFGGRGKTCKPEGFGCLTVGVLAGTMGVTGDLILTAEWWQESERASIGNRQAVQPREGVAGSHSKTALGGPGALPPSPLLPDQLSEVPLCVRSDNRAWGAIPTINSQVSSTDLVPGPRVPCGLPALWPQSRGGEEGLPSFLQASQLCKAV